MKKIVLVGAGGHCKVIIDCIKSRNEFEIVGITDYKKQSGLVLDVPIIGNDDILEQVYNEGTRCAFICVGALENLEVRNKLYQKLKGMGFTIPTLIHKKAIVSPYAEIGEGTCIMAGSIINPDAVIGTNCIINTGVVIEHDCKIGSNSHISPSAALAGNVTVGCNVHIGIGSSVIQCIQIGDNATIGAGAVVIENIESNAVAVGVPAKIIKHK